MTLLETHREPRRRPVTGKPTFRDLAVELITANRKTPVADLVAPYVKVLKKNPAALATLAEFALDHVKSTLALETTRGAATRVDPVVEERRRRVKATARQIVKNLMEHKTPYGKPTADCSGTELWRLGGWYGVLSKLAGGRNSSATLREKGVTEAQLQKALRAS